MNNRAGVLVAGDRYERRAEHFQALADLGCVLPAYRRLARVTNVTKSSEPSHDSGECELTSTFAIVVLM